MCLRHLKSLTNYNHTLSQMHIYRYLYPEGKEFTRKGTDSNSRIDNIWVSKPANDASDITNSDHTIISILRDQKVDAYVFPLLNEDQLMSDGMKHGPSKKLMLLIILYMLLISSEITEEGYNFHNNP